MSVSLYGIQRDRFDPDIWTIIERVAGMADACDPLSGQLVFTLGKDTVVCTPTDVVRKQANMVHLKTTMGIIHLYVQGDGTISEEEWSRQYPHCVTGRSGRAYPPADFFEPPVWPRELCKNGFRQPKLRTLGRKVFGLTD